MYNRDGQRLVQASQWHMSARTGWLFHCGHIMCSAGLVYVIGLHQAYCQEIREISQENVETQSRRQRVEKIKNNTCTFQC